jgi:hypothetical protein
MIDSDACATVLGLLNLLGSPNKSCLVCAPYRDSTIANSSIAHNLDERGFTTYILVCNQAISTTTTPAAVKVPPRELKLASTVVVVESHGLS